MARILVIEHDPQISLMVQSMLQVTGHEIVLAQVGESGTRRLISEDFDLIPAHVHLPAGAGMEVIADLRRVAPTVPVVAIASGSENPSAYADRLGAREIVLKPFTRQTLVDAVNRWLPSSPPKGARG